MLPRPAFLVALLFTVSCTSQPSGVTLSPGPAVAHDHAGSGPLPCAEPAPPLGGLPPAVPSWCLTLGPASDTAHVGRNNWLDEFKSGVSNAHVASSYRVFDAARSAPTTVYRTEHFAHNGHWMVDVGGHGAPSGVYEGSAADFYIGPNNGGGLMRPDKEFRFDNGRFVIEVDVSAGMLAYGDRAWPEIVVTTAPEPTREETNGWYAAGVFGGYPTVACGLPSDRLAECRVYDAEKITARLSADSAAGARESFGGAPRTKELASAWRECAATDPDDLCRDRFRLVLERDAVTLYVNGVLYMQQRGLPQAAGLSDELINSPVYVYFGSWVYLVEPSVTRFHWGRIAVNP